MIRTVFAAVGAPLAWSVQIASSEPLAAMACGGPAPRVAPGLPSHAGLLLIIVSAACLFVAAMSAWLACADWRGAHQRLHADLEVTPPPGGAGGSRHGRPCRERAGRRRFLAALGAMAGLLFLTGVVFTAISLLLVPSCAA